MKAVSVESAGNISILSKGQPDLLPSLRIPPLSASPPLRSHPSKSGLARHLNIPWRTRQPPFQTLPTRNRIPHLLVMLCIQLPRDYFPLLLWIAPQGAFFQTFLPRRDRP